MSSAAMTLPTDIDEVVFDQERDEEESRRPEGFVIDSQDKATWAARRSLQAEKRIKERERLAKQNKAKIDAWLERVNKDDHSTTETMRALLTPFVKQELSGSTRKRSIDLLGVRVGFRKLPERVEVVDTEKAIAFCERNHPDVVIVKKELSKSGLRKVAQQGEFVPGVLLDGGQDRLVVTELATE